MTPDNDNKPDGARRRPALRHGRTAGTSTLEWIIASISTLVVAATIGFLISEAIDGRDTLPLIEIQTDSIIPHDGSYIVELTIINTGHTTASQLVIEGTLLQGDTTIQSSTTTLDYLPAQSLRRAALIFTHDPTRYHLHLRPTGFTYP